jgi:YgiT-type zinc finger domain-containing protein
MTAAAILTKIQTEAATEAVRVTQHARLEMDQSNAKEPEMRCNIADCLGKYEQREVVHTVRQGDRIIVINHVPAEVCTVCGDVLFTPATVRRIEALRKTTAPPARSVPLYEFSEAVSA